jgi:5'-methylthioadenosine phosphorylase
MAKIGIIGGSGLYSLLENHKPVEVNTPYGKPSSALEIGEIDGIEVVFLPRHGKKHSIPPHKVNYRANIRALFDQGVERIISANAVGSLKQEYPPGMMFIPDQYIDFTKRRELTYYDGPDVYHISSADPFCPEMNDVLASKSKSLRYQTHQGGTYACIEGPRFSTRAESKMFRQFADIIGMTLVPEINLANELAMCYTSLATITDYDVWAEEPVDTKEVLKILKENEDKSLNIIKQSLKHISGTRKCDCKRRLDDAKI